MTTSAPDAAQPPVVLIHGATASARVWDPVLPMLSAKHRVFVPTLAGHHGGPAVPTGPAKIVDKIVDATCRQLDEAAIDTAHFVGNSLGGWVALELARRGRAQSVLALSPAGAWRSPRDLRRMLRLFRGAAAFSRSKRFPALAERKHVRRILMRLMAERADRMTPEQVAYAFDDIVRCTVLTELLDGAFENGSIQPIADVDCRVRIAWGLHDRMLPFMRYGAPMLAAVPAAEFGFLWGVGHVPMIDDPELVANTILDFLDSVDV
ncbi:alpha/beta fold hydrolase [Mycobacterium sp.]|uniref:alpha/beta fold hydrolase n=1 Tax=Mycobacterium sp. TaxID=1785 RepID=UPI000CB30929|nr:alpha/beta fold hydrolase [Mycobacterium sp.]PJE16028.1 MAG: alpha/beta hydrolase [Mycobacterium sp.]